MMIQKIKNIFLWFFSRLGFFYIVVFLFLFFMVDGNNLKNRIKVGKLNYYYPKFEEFHEYIQGQRPSIDVESFRQYFNIALEYVPYEPGAMMAMAHFALREENIQQAIQYLSKTMELYPGLFWNAYNLGILAYRANAGDFVEKALTASLMIPPQMAIYHMRLSIVYRQILSKVGETYDMLRAISLAKENAKILLADYYFKQKNFQKAFLLATEALKDPHLMNKSAMFFYAYQSASSLGQEQTAEQLKQQQELLKLPKYTGITAENLVFRFF